MSEPVKRKIIQMQPTLEFRWVNGLELSCSLQQKHEVVFEDGSYGITWKPHPCIDFSEAIKDTFPNAVSIE